MAGIYLVSFSLWPAEYALELVLMSYHFLPLRAKVLCQVDRDSPRPLQTGQGTRVRCQNAPLHLRHGKQQVAKTFEVDAP